MQVGTWMTADPQTVRPGDTLAQAEEKMRRGGFRRLPVVDDGGTLLGIVTDRDLREHVGALAATRVTGAMVERPVTITPDAPIEAAAHLILERKIGGLPVVTAGGALVGIITETDLLRGLLRGLGGADTSARIDFEFTRPEQRFGEAVAVVEAAGGTILGLGTMRASDAEPGGARTFYLRLTAGDVERLADALRQAGYRVHAVHPPAAA
jgi:acetoin utilization protein AcuB